MTSVIAYDLVVIGSGPGGQKAAVAAAKLGKSVAVIERGDVGGVCVNTGTIPSKSMREAVVYLTGVNQHELYGTSYRVKDRITWTDLHVRTEHVINREIDVIRSQLKRNGIELYTGQGRFIDEHTVLVESPNRGEHITLGGQYVVIATGTTPARPAGVQFDEECVIGIRRHSEFEVDPVVDGGRRCRRHRRRICLDIRRAGHQGDRRRETRHNVGFL